MNIKRAAVELCRLVAQPAFTLVLSPVTGIGCTPLADALHFFYAAPVILILRFHPPARLTPGFAGLFAGRFGTEALPVLCSWIRRELFLAVETFLWPLYFHRASWSTLTL